MAIVFSDDDGRTINTGSGFRPLAGTAGVVSTTLTGSTQSLTLPAGGGIRGQSYYRMACTLPFFFAIDKAGQAASYTGATNMDFCPGGIVDYFRTEPNDTTIYVLQQGAGGVFSINVQI